MRYLLDTNILSAVIKDQKGVVAQRMLSVAADPQNQIVSSIVVACEVQFGLEKKGSANLNANVEAIFGYVEILPLTKGVDAMYGRIRNKLESQGEPIGALDYLIAAHALSLDAVLVTDNIREFKKVEGLRIENWLRPQA